jgi:hypothetical protein
MSLPSLQAVSQLQTSATVLTNAVNSAKNLANLILVTPFEERGIQVQNPPDPSGAPSTLIPPKKFLFNFEGEQSVVLDSDITDHYVEDNTALQDQIALKPITITTAGFISELNDVPPIPLKYLKAAVNTLVTLQPYVPQISLAAQIAYNEAFQFYQIGINALNAAVGAWTSLSGLRPEQNKQQEAFIFFYGYWAKRTLFTIQTPWAIFQNMAIKNVTAVQDESTKTMTTFNCTFKQMRFAKTTTNQNNTTNGRLYFQTSPVVNQGVSTPLADQALTTGLTGPDSASFPGLF